MSKEQCIVALNEFRKIVKKDNVSSLMIVKEEDENKFFPRIEQDNEPLFSRTYAYGIRKSCDDWLDILNKNYDAPLK